MANVAPYTVDVTGSDDETFAWSVDFEMTDGTPFDFGAYEIEYAVMQDDGGQSFILTQDDGISVSAPTVTFKAVRGTLAPGRYIHGCRIRNVGGDEIQVFDGAVLIGEGAFA